MRFFKFLLEKFLSFCNFVYSQFLASYNIEQIILMQMNYSTSSKQNVKTQHV